MTNVYEELERELKQIEKNFNDVVCAEIIYGANY